MWKAVPELPNTYLPCLLATGKATTVESSKSFVEHTGVCESVCNKSSRICTVLAYRRITRRQTGRMAVGYWAREL